MRALAWSLLLFMYSDQRPTTTTIIIFIIVVMREKCLYLFIVVSSTHRRTPGPGKNDWVISCAVSSQKQYILPAYIKEKSKRKSLQNGVAWLNIMVGFRFTDSFFGWVIKSRSILPPSLHCFKSVIGQSISRVDWLVKTSFSRIQLDWLFLGIGSLVWVSKTLF